MKLHIGHILTVAIFVAVGTAERARGIDYQQLLESTPAARPGFGEVVGDFTHCGNQAIDALRKEFRRNPTTRENYTYRRSLANVWVYGLINMGMDVQPALGGALGGKQYRANDIPETILPALLKKMDDGLAELEKTQQELFQSRPGHFRAEVLPVPEGTSDDNWMLHRKDPQNTGRTTDPGPSRGELAWKSPMGHTWYAKPLVEDGRVYTPSPGRSTTGYCLDENSGKVLWTARQDAMINRHFTAKICSSAVSWGDQILLRESGSWGNQARQQAVHVLFLDKKTGKKTRAINVRHADYRAGFAGMACSDDFLVYPHGTHEILSQPPVITPLNRLACKNIRTGQLSWDIHLGDMFCEPVADSQNAWAATADGTLVCVNFHNDPILKWQFNAPAGIYTSPVIAGGRLYFGANDGAVYCLEKHTGQLVWRTVVSQVEPRAKMQLTSPTVTDTHLYIGAADSKLYSLNLSDGSTEVSVKLSDWVRSRPVVVNGVVYVAAMDGMVHALQHADRELKSIWEAKVTDYEVFADLVAGSSTIIASTSDLMLVALDLQSGQTRWRHSLLECVYLKDGTRVLADGGSGGNHQSTPIVAGQNVFVGGANRFVYCLDKQTGRRLWKYETDGQVSAAPVYDSGKLYFGGQGGSDEFCCVRAGDGSPVWKQNIGWVWTSANISGNRVITVGCDGAVHCLDKDTGAILWRYKLGGGSYPTPSIDKGLVFVGGWGGWYYALDLKSGKLHWKYYLSGRPDSGASLAFDGKVYIQGHGYVQEQLLPGEVPPPVSGGLICLDTRTGRPLWKEKPSNASLALDLESKRLFGILRSNLLALRAADGKTLWEEDAGVSVSGPSVAGSRVYVATTFAPYMRCFDVNGDQPQLLWEYKMDACVGEPCPVIAGGMAFILCLDGNVYAFK